MIVDTSAIVALSLEEPKMAWVRGTIADFPGEILRMSWVNIAEVEFALMRGNPLVRESMEGVLRHFGIEALEANFEIIRLVADARLKFPINFGDCFAYAHARLLNEPLITLDADFLKTDLPLVLHPDRAP